MCSNKDINWTFEFANTCRQQKKKEEEELWITKVSIKKKLIASNGTSLLFFSMRISGIF